MSEQFGRRRTRVGMRSVGEGETEEKEDAESGRASDPERGEDDGGPVVDGTAGLPGPQGVAAEVGAPPSAPPSPADPRRWPNTHITLRSDGHYGRPEVMAFCEAEGIDYVFGLPTNAVLRTAVEDAADDVRVRRAEEDAPVLRRYAETCYGAKSWGQDIHFVATSFARGSAEWVYDNLYCARGQAENLLKLHKAQLASDRTSCRSPLANQVRLAFAAACPHAVLFRGLARSFHQAGP